MNVPPRIEINVRRFERTTLERASFRGERSFDEFMASCLTKEIDRQRENREQGKNLPPDSVVSDPAIVIAGPGAPKGRFNHNLESPFDSVQMQFSLGPTDQKRIKEFLGESQMDFGLLIRTALDSALLPPAPEIDVPR